MFGKILVALDRDETSLIVFKEAVALAQATGARLMLLSAIASEEAEGLTIPASSGLAYYSLSASEAVWEVYHKHLREYEAKGLERLRQLTEEAAALGVQAEFTQSLGNPERVICDLARTWNADLIVVGSHQRTGLSEWVMGSVSNYVMHHAPCSVLVINKPSSSQATVKTASLTTAESL